MYFAHHLFPIWSDQNRLAKLNILIGVFANRIENKGHAIKVMLGTRSKLVLKSNIWVWWKGGGYLLTNRGRNPTGWDPAFEQPFVPIHHQLISDFHFQLTSHLRDDRRCKNGCFFGKLGEGGVKAVWKFSKNTSIFAPTVVPKAAAKQAVKNPPSGRKPAENILT